MLIDPYTAESNPIAVAIGIGPNTFAVIQGAYPGLEKDVGAIETIYHVGTPSILQIEICYVTQSFNFSETIFIDTTNSATFWGDILNWLYSINRYGITYNSTFDEYLLNEPNAYCVFTD